VDSIIDNVVKSLWLPQ